MQNKHRESVKQETQLKSLIINIATASLRIVCVTLNNRVSKKTETFCIIALKYFKYDFTHNLFILSQLSKTILQYFAH